MKKTRFVKLFIKIVLFIAIFLGAEHLVHFCMFDDTDAISRMMLHELYHQGEDRSENQKNVVSSESNTNVDCEEHPVQQTGGKEGTGGDEDLQGRGTAQEEGIAVLFCGASHVQLSFDPSVTDEIFDCNTFNAGSSAQPLEATNAIIREAASLYDLKEVYVDLDYSIATRSEVNLESIYAVSDYMRPSTNKVQFLLHATPARYYINSFLPLGQGRTLTRNPSEIAEIVKKKFSYNYRHYISDVDSYMGKGYIASHVYLNQEANGNEKARTAGNDISDSGQSAGTDEDYAKSDYLTVQKEVFEKELSDTPPSQIPDSIPLQDQDTLDDIIDFCRENGIRLTFVVTPMSDYFLTQIGNYDDYISMVKDFLSGKGVSFYDFNLAKPKYLDLRDIGYYTDSNHLNRDGAALFSRVFAEFFTGQIPEDQLFYKSFQEKLSQME